MTLSYRYCYRTLQKLKPTNGFSCYHDAEDTGAVLPAKDLLRADFFVLKTHIGVSKID